MSTTEYKVFDATPEGNPPELKRVEEVASMSTLLNVARRADSLFDVETFLAREKVGDAGQHGGHGGHHGHGGGHGGPSDDTGTPEVAGGSL